MVMDVQNMSFRDTGCNNTQTNNGVLCYSLRAALRTVTGFMCAENGEQFCREDINRWEVVWGLL